MIRRLLVANRGEIARRIFATCRAMGIETVSVYSEPDRDAPFVSEADLAVSLGGSTPAESYLDMSKVLDAAKRGAADAVHPGYGFLSENAAFAGMVMAAGLTWVGPAPRSIELMGSKLESKRMITEAGVPTLPSLDVTGVGADELARSGAEIGYPLLVKASAGGGGKGMRIVSVPEDLTVAVESAGREAMSAFGDPTVFLERFLARSRHIEIQIFGDTLGNVVSMFERECSIQRRHQKIIEESPSTALTPELREQMGEAAVAAARSVDYVGAGTVEFLFQDGEFFFLEMNTRLQVEHPVTEAITGLDLVRLQILVAQGLRLPPEALSPTASGHAIEARLYAEDPEAGYLPATGTLSRFHFPEDQAIRVDSGVESGSVISVFYDPMLAKVIAWAENRSEAAGLLASALHSAEIHGSITNRDLLVGILRHPEFLSGETDTGFLDRHDASTLSHPGTDPLAEQAAGLAAVLCASDWSRRKRQLLTAVPEGWRNNPSQLEVTSFTGRGEPFSVGFRFGRDGSLTTSLDTSVRMSGLTSNAVDLEIDGVRMQYRVRREGTVHHVDSPNGYLRLVEQPRFPRPEIEEEPGSLHAPMPGKIISVTVASGDSVTEGQTLVVMEAMKMEHTLKSPVDGRVVSLRVAVGDQVEADQVLVVVEG